MRFVFVVLSLVLFVSTAHARDWYVSTEGKGKKGTLQKPAKDLGNIASRLAAGDVIHIAEGAYVGRGKCGSDVITVPVQIIGGYSNDFKTRDPWGKHRTILTGDNMSKNWVRTPRIFIDLMKYKGTEMPNIVVDGVIIDNAGRNRYKTDAQQSIIRMANPKTGQNPTPDQGGLVIRVQRTGTPTGAWNILVQNCVVANCAPSQGALSVSGYRKTKVTIRNNIVINNTGTGLLAGTKYRPRDNENKVQFLIENNTILCTWKFDPSAQSYSGNAFKADPDTIVVARGNVIGFSDKYGIHNAAKANITLIGNVIVGNVEADYLEFDTKIDLEDMEDEAEHLGDDTEDNVKEKINIPIGKEWATLYGSRVLVDRNAAEADIKAQKTAANEIRAMLGLPLQAGTVDGPGSPVWLHRISIDDAIAAGQGRYGGKYGSAKPASASK